MKSNSGPFAYTPRGKAPAQLNPVQMVIGAICFGVAGLFGAMVVQNTWLTISDIQINHQSFCGAC